MNKREKYRKRFAQAETDRLVEVIVRIVAVQPSFNVPRMIRPFVYDWLSYAFTRGALMAGQWRRQDAKKKARKS